MVLPEMASIFRKVAGNAADQKQGGASAARYLQDRTMTVRKRWIDRIVREAAALDTPLPWERALRAMPVPHAGHRAQGAAQG